MDRRPNTPTLAINVAAKETSETFKSVKSSPLSKWWYAIVARLIFAILPRKTLTVMMSDNRWDQEPSELDEQLKKLWQQLTGKKSGGNTSGPSGPANMPLPKNAIIAGLVAAAVLYLLAGFYTVDAKEQAVILRLGTYSHTAQPGLRWRFLLIDQRFQENVTQQRTYSLKREMLTEDQNIIEVPISVQYRVKNIEDFVLKVENPIESMHSATEAALRHVVGTSRMDRVLSIGREAIGIQVHERLQQRLDLYFTGIDITKVNILRGNPPSQVQEAFDDVIKAQEDRERMKNEAEAYANKIIPETRGEVQRVLQEANGYKQRVISRSQGEANRFILLEKQYSLAPEVTRTRLFLESMEEVMGNTTKVLVDSDSGNQILMLPLAGQSSNDPSPNMAFDPDDPESIQRLSQQLLGPISEQLRNQGRTRTSRSERRNANNR